ncbi:PTS lactose/cellobiose transporter subunit IIA [Youngiibacter fragilis]|uniref:PTS lactose/cellobiose transporter subunit IIA n=1 Tax=Youngiibacter fragilis TaxID=1408819 RepID=UPI00128ED71C|nr:PTS lactose/cellobiose transporter subunit IIA [Youngiibacter fragilis]
MNVLEELIMQIIIDSGDVRYHAYEALTLANEGKFEEARESIKRANEAMEKAHEAQTSVLFKEANGEKVEISALFVHSQDHLMTAISEKNLIAQLIEMRKSIQDLIEAKNN